MMIALLIGLILTGGAIQIFASSQQAYRTNQALSRIQENGRYAMQFLTESIRGAAFWGCAQELEVNNVVLGGTNVDFDGEATIGEDGGPGSPDSITLRMAAHNTGIGIVQQMPKVSANLFLSETDEIQEGDVMVVTDCVSADVFMVTNNHTNNDNLEHNSGVSIQSLENSTQKMSKAYGTDAVAYSVAQYTYEIVDNSLQRTTNGVTTETLVDGVVDMQLSYGVDTDNDETPNAYLDANEVDANAGYNWDEVLAVRIELLVRSEYDNLAAIPQQQVWDFDGDGTLDDAPDGRMYHRFGATVGVRNRI